MSVGLKAPGSKQRIPKEDKGNELPGMCKANVVAILCSDIHLSHSNFFGLDLQYSVLQINKINKLTQLYLLLGISSFHTFWLGGVWYFNWLCRLLCFVQASGSYR